MTSTAPLSPHQETVDPVCGMRTSDPSRWLVHEHAGRLYHFCSRGCREMFVRDPAAYQAVSIAVIPRPMARGPGADVAVRLYTCPMHPEVRQPGPGACPKCGMAL